MLERQRIRCWIAHRDITPGEEWGAAIINGIRESRIMVLIFSRHANASKQVRREVERAISRGITVLSFRIEDVLPEGSMEYALGNTHWLDAFTPPVERQLDLLSRSVETLLANEAESVATPCTSGLAGDRRRARGSEKLDGGGIGGRSLAASSERVVGGGSRGLVDARTPRRVGARGEDS